MVGITVTCIILCGLAFIPKGTPVEGTTDYSLVGGMYDSEGRVEVISNDTNVTSICDSLWGIEDAIVICKFLNYTGADLALVAGYFGNPGNSPAYDDVTCTGLEDHLLQCNYSYVDSVCPHSGKGAGVMCTAQGSLRLANGTVPGEGRVEILGESGDWGTICDDGWDKTDAGVACRQLGYPDALEAIVNVRYPYLEPVFGRGSGPIFLDGLACSGDERHLRDCWVTKKWGIHDCTHGEDAGVQCDTKLIRLEVGEYSNQGRVEVYYGGTWGTICPSLSWNIEAAHVACKELGFLFGALEAISVDGGDGPVLLDEINCFGNESRLVDCESYGWAKVKSCTPYSHRSQSTAGVICSDPANLVRLLSGSTSYEGVVEYRFSFEPSLICDPDWNENEASVICRQLGYQYGRSEKPVSLGPLSGTILYRNYRCNGTEQHLGDCQFSLFLEEECDPPNHIAQVKCGPPKEYDLRLIGSDYTEQGRVDMYLNNEWGSITHKYFSYTEARTVCRQIGYEDASPVPNTNNVFERGSGRIVIDNLDCYSYHNKITDCRILFTGNSSANTHDDELEVICVPYVSVSNHPVRLINEKGEINRDYGRVEIFHDGIWGSVCEGYFNDADLLCRELGHTDTYAHSLQLALYNFPDSSWRWFSLITCDLYYNLLDVEHLFQCRFTPWGYDDEYWCYGGNFAGIKCIDNLPISPVDTTTHLSPSIISPSVRMEEWKIVVIAIAFIVPLICVVCCCFHRHKSKTTDSPNSVAFTSSTNNGSRSVTLVSPPPRYVPSLETPAELPPSYDSVIQPTDQSGDNVNPYENVPTNDSNGSINSPVVPTNVSDAVNVGNFLDVGPTNPTERTGDVDRGTGVMSTEPI